MNIIKGHRFFKIICLALVVTFISLDISYAYPPEHNLSNSTLATPSLLQQQSINEHMARFQRSVFSKGALLASVYDIGEYFFGRPERKMESLPSKYAEEVVRAGLGKILGDSGIEILNIVPVEYLKTTVPEKLNSALSEIGFKGTLPDEGVVFILYKKDSKKFLVQIAEKAKVSVGNLPGYEWVISDKYVVKYMPEDYEEGKLQSSLRGSEATEAISSLDVVKEAPKVTITEPIAQVSVSAPDVKASQTSSNPKRIFSIREIISYLVVLLMIFTPLTVRRAIAQVMTPAPAPAVTQASGDTTSVKPEVVPALIEALMYDNLFDKKTVMVGALVKIGAPAVPALIKALEDSSPNVRFFAAENLGEIGNIEAISALTAAVNDPDEFVRKAAKKAIEAIKNKNITAPGSKKSTTMYSVNPFAVIFNVAALGAIFSAAKDFAFAHPIIAGIAALGIGIAAVFTIWRMFFPISWHLFWVRFAKGKSVHIEALIKTGKPAAPYIIKALGSSNSDVRWLAAYILGKIGPVTPEVVPALVKALGDRDGDVRSIVAAALIKINDRRLSLMDDYLMVSITPYGYNKYHEVLKEEEISYILECLNNNVSIKGQYVPYVPHSSKARLIIKMDDGASSATLYSINPFTAMFIASALGAIFSAAKDFAFAHPIIAVGIVLAFVVIAWRIVDWLRRTSFPVEMNLRDLIHKKGPGAEKYFMKAESSVIPVLVEAFNRGTPDTRKSIAKILVMRKDRHVTEPFIGLLLKDSDLEVRMATLRELVRAKDPLAIKSLAEILSDMKCAGYALRYLYHMKVRNSILIDPLAKVLSEAPEPHIRKRAISILEDIEDIRVVGLLIKVLKEDKDEGVLYDALCALAAIKKSKIMDSIDPAHKSILEFTDEAKSLIAKKVKTYIPGHERHVINARFIYKVVYPILNITKDLTDARFALRLALDLCPSKVTVDITGTEKRYSYDLTKAIVLINNKELLYSKIAEFKTELLQKFTESVVQQLKQNKEMAPQDLFLLIQSNVPASMEGLTNALRELEPLSKQTNLSADVIAQSITQAKEKYKLSEDETKILWLALTGPGQGMGTGRIATELQAKWTDKMKNAQELGIKVTINQLDEIAAIKKETNGIEYFESKIHGMGINGDNQWHKEGTVACFFDETKFNFTKLYKDIRPQHVLYEANMEKDSWYIGMNDTPILKYHMIVAPKKARQQLAARKDIVDMQQLLAQIGDEKAALLHNSLLGGAGINSLHYHLFFYDFPIFKEGFPIYSGTGKFVTKSFAGKNCAQEAGSYLEELQGANQPYNLIMRYGRIIIIPRPHDIEFRYGADALAGVVLYGNDRTLEDATWYVPETSKQENVKPLPARISKATQLFEIVESSLNDKRAQFINAGNRLIDSLPAKSASEAAANIGALDSDMATAEIRQRVEKAITVIESSDAEGIAPEVKTAIGLLKKDLNQFEADGAVGALIVLARRAKRENQKLIIGLETDWIPGVNIKKSCQKQAIFALMKEIDAIGDALKSMGLDNVEIIRGSGKDLADTLLGEAEKTRTNLRNIVVMASSDTINSASFAALRNADENDRPFIAGIDPAELIKFYSEFGETTGNQLYVRLTQLLCITLELAAGKEPPHTPMIVSYDKKMRIVIFLPKAEPLDYELLKKAYAAEKAALAAA